MPTTIQPQTAPSHGLVADGVLPARGERAAALPEGDSAPWTDERAPQSNEVADFCGYSRKAIYRAIERGELRATKRCSRWRIWAEDLELWLEGGVPAHENGGRRRQPPAPAPTPARRGSFRALLASEEDQS